MNKTKELWENYFANDFPWYQAYGIAADTIGITTANSIWNTLCNKEHRKNYKNRIARQLELIHRWDAQIPRQRTPAW
jgi:hypothetical protein